MRRSKSRKRKAQIGRRLKVQFADPAERDRRIKIRDQALAEKERSRWGAV